MQQCRNTINTYNSLIATVFFAVHTSNILNKQESRSFCYQNKISAYQSSKRGQNVARAKLRQCAAFYLSCWTDKADFETWQWHVSVEDP